MPINLTAFSVQTEWEGCTWSVASIDELANAIAIVAVGQTRHAEKILRAAGLHPKLSRRGAVRGAIALLTAAADSSHRDGWMFQVMSWLAAHLRTPGALIRTPHTIHAHKGLDGLQVDIDDSHKVTAVVIFEDKATTNPRSMVRSKVWPEFLAFEGGEQEHHITAEVTDLLSRASHPDPEKAVAEIMWNQARSYRLSITDNQSTDESQAVLFKGYQATVAGKVERRRAEIFEVTNLRAWMDALATEAIKKAQALPTSD